MILFNDIEQNITEMNWLSYFYNDVEAFQSFKVKVDTDNLHKNVTD